jgi:hypothetical protein
MLAPAQDGSSRTSGRSHPARQVQAAGVTVLTVHRRQQRCSGRRRCGLERVARARVLARHACSCVPLQRTLLRLVQQSLQQRPAHGRHGAAACKHSRRRGATSVTEARRPEGASANFELDEPTQARAAPRTHAATPRRSRHARAQAAAAGALSGPGAGTNGRRSPARCNFLGFGLSLIPEAKHGSQSKVSVRWQAATPDAVGTRAAAQQRRKGEAPKPSQSSAVQCQKPQASHTRRHESSAMRVRAQR